jgi:hypothetical protein
MLTGVAIWLSAALFAGPGDLPTETPPIPWAGHDTLPREIGEPHLLFINFDGAVLRGGCGNDAKLDCSTLADTFDGYIGPFDGSDTTKANIIQQVRKDLSAFGVTTVGKRPPPEVDYSMVLYGDLGSQGFAGIAPYIDCADIWKNDTSFSVGYDSANQGSTVILQEAAHTWGLEHVNQPADILHPVTEGVSPGFVDNCEQIVSNTALDDSSGVCNTIHTLFCDPGQQNSFQELLYLFGPPVADDEAPTVEWIHPEPDSSHEMGSIIILRAQIDDNLDPQWYSLTVKVDGETILEDSNFFDDFIVDFNPPEARTYDLELIVQDQAGNEVSSEISFTYVEPGELDPDLEQGCSVLGDGGPDAWWALLLLPLLRCRRRS